MDNPALHPLVQLLVKRMESHPDEFTNDWPQDSDPQRDVYSVGMHDGRWGNAIHQMHQWCNDEEKAALNAGMRTIMMNRIHSEVMDELLNGEERRREQRRVEEEYILKQQAAKQQAAQAGTQKLYAHQLQNAGNQLSGLQGISSLQNMYQPTLQIEDQVLNAQTIRDLNKLLKEKREGKSP